MPHVTLRMLITRKLHNATGVVVAEEAPYGETGLYLLSSTNIIPLK